MLWPELTAAGYPVVVLTKKLNRFFFINNLQYLFWNSMIYGHRFVQIANIFQFVVLQQKFTNFSYTLWKNFFVALGLEQLDINLNFCQKEPFLTKGFSHGPEVLFAPFIFLCKRFF